MPITFLFMLALWQIYTNKQPAMAYLMGTAGEEFGEKERNELENITERTDYSLQMGQENIGDRMTVLSLVICSVIGLLTFFYFTLSLAVIESLPYRFVTSFLMLVDIYTQVISAKFFVEYFRKKEDPEMAGTPWGPQLCVILTIHAVVTIILLLVM